MTNCEARAARPNFKLTGGNIMARATKRDIRPPQYEYTLTLTQDEARVLRGVCGRISGQTEGDRGQMDNISIALDSIGVDRAHYGGNLTI